MTHECKRILNFQCKCSDMSATSFGSTEVEGYVPYIEGLGGGDYVNLDICVECGKLQGFDCTMSDERLKELLVEGE